MCSLQWRHNERDGVSNHQRLDCLHNHLFSCRSKKTSKLRVTSFCGGNSRVTGEFPAQRASSAENVSIWWCHHIHNVTASQRRTVVRSWNRNAFRVHGPLWGEPPVTGGWSSQRASNVGFDIFFYVRPNNGWINSRVSGELKRRCGHCGILILQSTKYITPVRVTDRLHNTWSITLNNESISCNKCATMGQFLMTNVSQVYELCVSMVTYIWYWLNQIHVDKPQRAEIGPESTQCCKLDPAPFWHIF